MVQRVKDPSRAVPAGAWVAAVARIRSPAWELPHGTGVPERKKEGKKERKKEIEGREEGRKKKREREKERNQDKGSPCGRGQGRGWGDGFSGTGHFIWVLDTGEYSFADIHRAEHL